MEISKTILLGGSLRYSFTSLLFLAAFVSPLVIHAQEGNQKSNDSSIQVMDESDAKASVDSFLIALGNDELNKVRALMLPNANIAYFSTTDGKSAVTTMTADQFISQREGRQNRKFEEPVRQYSVNISQGKLAFVRADATVVYDGTPSHHTSDFFILMKENDAWKILSGSYTARPLDSEQ